MPAAVPRVWVGGYTHVLSQICWADFTMNTRLVLLVCQVGIYDGAVVCNMKSEFCGGAFKILINTTGLLIHDQVSANPNGNSSTFSCLSTPSLALPTLIPIFLSKVLCILRLPWPYIHPPFLLWECIPSPSYKAHIKPPFLSEAFPTVPSCDDFSVIWIFGFRTWQHTEYLFL